MRPKSFSDERDIFENQFLRLYSVEADFGEFTREYFVTDKGQRVGTVILRNDEILLVRQYRYLINDMSWEFPGGGIGDGETAEQAAIRECGEEAAIKCLSLTPFFRFHQGVDTTLSPADIFECTEFEVLPDMENDETDERRWVPYDEAQGWALDGTIKDPMTIMGLLVHQRTRR